MTLFRSETFNKYFDLFIISLIGVFAYFMTYRSGERGFFAFDQSIIFDGGYRVLLGQIPYKDFVTPFGPVTFWIQGIIFKLLGISYATYIFGAAFVNIIENTAGLSRYAPGPSGAPVVFVAFPAAIWAVAINPHCFGHVNIVPNP